MNKGNLALIAFKLALAMAVRPEKKPLAAFCSETLCQNCQNFKYKQK